VIQDEGQVDHGLGPAINTICPECGNQCVRHPVVDAGGVVCWRCFTPLPPLPDRL
jgi:formylmethanofuran dehydrogenase subunit E